MKSEFWKAPLLVAACLVSGATWAHHSTALYDLTASRTIQGTVKNSQWANPHNYVQMLVQDSSGKQTEWAIEAGTPATATRQGFAKDTFRPGMKVTMIIAPMRDGSPGGTLKTVKFADGKTLNSVAADPNATKPFDALPTLRRATPQ